MNKIFLILLLSIGLNAVAQSKVYSFSIKNSTKLEQQLKKCIGKDWEIRDYSIGDITSDGKNDIIVIATTTLEKIINRKVMLFVNQKTTFFKLVATNNNFIECKSCGGAGIGDPYQETIITNNCFSFETLYGACDKDRFVVTFQYDSEKKNWFLQKDAKENYNCKQELNPQNEIIITKTERNTDQYGKLKFEDYK
jgi:hypothetical protein